MKIFLGYEQTDQPAFDALQTALEVAGHEVSDCQGLKKQCERWDDEMAIAKLKAFLKDCDVAIYLIGARTKKRNRFIRLQLKALSERRLPLIVLNLNGIRSVDFDRAPLQLYRTLSLHIANHQEIVDYSLAYWPEAFARLLAEAETRRSLFKKPFRLEQPIYEQFGLDTSEL